MQSHINISDQSQVDTTNNPYNDLQVDHQMTDNDQDPYTMPADLATQPISLVEDLKLKSQAIQTAIDKKEEPLEILEQVNQTLSKRYDLVLQEFQSEPLSREATSKEFYKVAFKATADKLLQTKIIMNPDYLKQILRFFRNILVNFFPEDITSESLAEIVHSLFNLDAPLYTVALQSVKKRHINQVDLAGLLQAEIDDLSLDQRRIKEEYQWRSELKQGDRLDAIFSRQIGTSRISHWTRATVTQVLDDDSIYIGFDNEQHGHNKLVSRFGTDISMFKRFTDDFDWRYELKPGELIDSLDGESIWYKSTCLDIREYNQPPLINEPDAPMRVLKEAYIAYRYYDDVEGHKQDEEGKYVGWSNKYDEWISVSSPTIQRLNTLVKQYTIVSKSNMIYDVVVDDISDVIQNTEQPKIWAVFRNNFFSNLSSIPDYLNEFGQKGGFNKILDLLSNDKNDQFISLRHIQLILDFLSKTNTLWHRQFMCSYTPKLNQAVQFAILQRSQNNQGPLKQKFLKESLIGIQKALQNILRRYYTQEQYAQIMAEFNFDIGFLLLKSEKLEQRIQGLKEVIEQIKNTKFSIRKTIQARDVMKKLKDENVLDTIFGENYHIQLIQRSQEIIKFYINEKEITEVEINQIWQATKKDQQTKMEIYKIIQELAVMFKQDEIEMLVKRFSQIPPDQFVEKEIECVYELSKYSYKQQTFSVEAASLFWDIAVQERPYKKQIIEIAIDKFIDLIRNWDREQKGEFMIKCLANIKENKSSIQCIKILQKLLEQIPNYRIQNYPTLSEITNKLIKEDDLINLVIFDFVHYSEKVNEMWQKNEINETNVDTLELMNIPFTHRAQQFARLNFIRQMLINSQNQLEEVQLDNIWDNMMVRSKISIDQDIFFNWFKQLLSDQSKLSDELILKFFQTKMCKDDVNFKYIKKAGFDCILQIFLRINKNKDQIQVISMPNFNNSNAAVQTKLEFKVLIVPEDLVGIHLLWKLLADCDKKNNEVVAAVIDLITKVYHNLASSLEEQKHRIEDQFCRECLSKLKAIVSDPEAVDDDKKQIIKIMTLMLKSFFGDSEKNGTGTMRPHTGLSKGKLVEKLIIQNNITNMKNSPRYIEINVHSNMTIWQLKKIIADKLKQSPLRISLNRPDAKKKLITDLDHQALLSAFRFENYEVIHASKKPIQIQPRTNLLNTNKELVKEAREIFASWFNKFSNDGFMTPETCTDFIRNSTSDPTVLITDPRVVRLFNEYDRDIDGKITQEEFLDFYRDRAEQKPDLVWSNLQTHGIGTDLKPIQSNNYSDDPNEVKDPQLLPRFKLSSDQNIFNEIFSMIDQVGPDSSVSEWQKVLVGPGAQNGEWEKVKIGPGSQAELWQLIINLRTNPYIYAKLLSLSSVSELLEDKSPHRLLYNLQILQEFIDQYSVREKPFIKCYYIESQDYNKQFPSLDTTQINTSSNNYSSSPIKQDEPYVNESHRDELSAAPQSGIAIPLPPSNNGITIPIPPLQNNTNFIGPVAPAQNQNLPTNLAKNKEMLDTFKGDIVTEYIEDNIIPDEEIAQILGITDLQEIAEMRQNWIQSFVSNDGFRVLSKFLQNLMQNQDINGILSSSADRECLNEVLRIMNLLLLSTFIGNTEQSVIIQDIQSKITNKQNQDIDLSEMGIDEILEKMQPFASSSNTQQTTAQSNQSNNQANAGPQLIKKDVIQVNQENLQKQYEPLINILKGDLGSKILQSIDFNSFQQQILSIIVSVVCKEKLTNDDKSNIDSAQQLWICLTLFNPQLLEKIYEDYYQNKSNGVLGIILNKGLLCNNFSIRDCLNTGLRFVFTKIKSDKLTVAPNLFLLKVLIDNFNFTEYKSRESKQFFAILRDLFEIYFDSKSKNLQGFQDFIDSRTLAQDFIVKISTYESKEQKNKYFEDTNLIGYMIILNTLLVCEPHILTTEEYNGLSEYLVEKCLFTYKLDPLNVHITSDVDIANYEKPHIHKCVTMESRSACYNLIQTICKQKPELINALIEKYLHPLLYIIQKPKKAGFAPRSEIRSYHGFCGIRNLGCICYMNAMIQQFFHIPAFRYCLLATQDNQPPNYQNFENEQVDDNMLHQLMKFMGFLELSERQDYNPREFCFSFKDFSGQPTNVRIQQDSQEFLNLAFDRLEHLLNKTSQKYLLQNIFGGQTCSLMICKKCGNLRQNRENFYNLSLEVKNQKSIYEGLKKFISGEVINDFQCEACNQKVDVERKTVIESLPNVLIVHLARIVFDYDTFQNVKLNSRVEFPNVLNMKAYTYNEVMKQQQDLLRKAKQDQKKKAKLQAKKDKKATNDLQDSFKREDSKQEEGEDFEYDRMEQINTSPSKNDQDYSSEEEEVVEEEDIQMEVDSPEEDFQYKLVGVIVHMGTADAGHYISFININRGDKPEDTPEWLQTEKDKWLEFNDSNVKDYRFSNLEEDCFGGGQSNTTNYQTSEMKGDYSRNAYMLIYEKRRKQPMKIVLNEEIVQKVQSSQSSSSLDCDGTAISRDLSKHHLFYVVPQLQENLLNNLDNIKYDENSKEHYALVQFGAAKKFVPNEIYKNVQRDNYLFLIERSIFNNSFFQTTKEIIDTYITNAENGQTSQENLQNPILFDFIKRLIFDFLSMTTENKQLIDITKLLLRLIQLNDNELIKIVDDYILADKSKLAKDQKGFLESLLTNMDKDMRDMNQMILTAVVNRLFAIGRIDVVDNIMNLVFAMIPEDFSKNWLKLHQILLFLFEVTKSGYAQMSYMIQNKLISKLIDFFMENESPLVTQNKKRQTMGSNYAQPPLENVILIISLIVRNYKWINLTPDQQNIIVPDPSICSVYFMGHQNDQELPPLSQEDIFMLNQKAFYSKNLKAGYEKVEFARLISHLSFFNLQFSRKLCKRTLIGLNKTTDDIESYLHVIVLLLQMNDPFKAMRAEWLLGVPQLKIDKTLVFSQNVSQMTTKIGVQIMDVPADDVYEYKSTLFKQSTNTRQSFLQLLYQFRRSWSKYTFQCLMCIFQACQQDQTGYIWYYIKTLEPPSYAFGRYIDWIMPYIEDQIETSKKFQTSTSQQELLFAIQCQTLFDSLLNPEKYKAQAQQQVQQQDQVQVQDDAQKSQQSIEQDIKKPLVEPFNHSSMDGGPDQYIIWNIIDEKVIESIRFDDQGIILRVRELTCKISESKPTGETNSVFPPDQFQQNRINNRGGQQRNNNVSDQMRNNIGVGSDQSKKDFEVRKRQYGRGAQYQVEQKGGATFMVAKKRNPPKRGSGQKKKRNKGQPMQYQPNYSANQQDGDTVNYSDKDEEAQNQDDSMEVEYEEDNQDQSEQYYDENPYNQNSNNFNHDEYQSMNAPQDNFQDATNNYYDPQEEPATQIENSPNKIKDGRVVDQYGNLVQSGVVPIVNNQNNSQDNEQDPYNQFVESSTNKANLEQEIVNSGQNPFIQNQNMEEIEQNDQNDQNDYNLNQIDAWEAASQTVLIFSVSNIDNTRPQTVTLTFTDHTQPGQQPLNFRIPRTSIPALLMGNQERDVAAFTKLRPFEEQWGNYQYHLQVVAPKNGMESSGGLGNAKVGVDNSISPAKNNNTVSIGPIMMDSNTGGHFDEMMDADGLSGYKECPQCTYHNLTILSFCEMCQHAL